MDIRNAQQQLILTTRGTSVFDGQNNFIGSVDARGTFDASGRQVSSSQAPALLLR